MIFGEHEAKWESVDGPSRYARHDEFRKIEGGGLSRPVANRILAVNISSPIRNSGNPSPQGHNARRLIHPK